MFDGLISGIMAEAICSVAAESEVTELRLRLGRPLVVRTAEKREVAKLPAGGAYIITRDDIDRLLAMASDFSVYAVNDELIKGYMARRGIRIGVAGEGVAESGKLLTMKNISFLTVRIPHQLTGIAGRVLAKMEDGLKNTLVISPPGAGKTTMLRELARVASKRADTLIIDERFELAAADKGLPTMDVGDCDVLSGVAKAAAYENTVRAMSPELIVTDELFRREDVEAVAEILRSGVKVFASVHGTGMAGVRASIPLSGICDLFEVVVTLTGTPRAGTIKDIWLKS
jgi:stage III sporulation protein AA